MSKQYRIIVGMFCLYGISPSVWSAPEQRVDFETSSLSPITWRAQTTGFIGAMTRGVHHLAIASGRGPHE